MELWVRNQDKENLIKVDALEICEECNDDENFVYEVITFYQDKIVVLGDYKTKERALEVLDEIHQRLINLGTIEIAPDSYIVLPKDTSNVYEMPKE